MVRTVPRSSIRSGMTLGAVPPFIMPTLTTPATSGSKDRLTTVCSMPTNWLAITTGSLPCCGMPPWQPTPCTRMVKPSQAASSAPSRTATRPLPSIGLLCRP
ncbi:hypothetical protein D3C87_1728260 [compost metagenome]